MQDINNIELINPVPMTAKEFVKRYAVGYFNEEITKNIK